jgi:hypothetical protein
MTGSGLRATTKGTTQRSTTVRSTDQKSSANPN